MGIIDTGANYRIAELSGKTYVGYNAATGNDGQQDREGHGTMVSTTAAAKTDNLRSTAAPAVIN